MKLKELTSPDQLDEVFKRSHQRPQLILKHSLTCPISTRAHDEVESYLGGTPETDVDYWLITIQSSRPTSTAVAERTGVRHESPQTIVLQKDKAVWNASHSAITEETLGQALTSR